MALTDEETKLRQLAAAMRELGVRRFACNGVELELDIYAGPSEEVPRQIGVPDPTSPIERDLTPTVGKFED